MPEINDFEEERVGQENEEDILGLNTQDFSQAVLWATDWTTETVISQLKKGNIELSPSFQRRDAWGNDRKSRFIESLILGLPIPQIILAERKEKKGSYIVIDGKQRLLSIRQFAVTEPQDTFNALKLSDLQYLKDLNKKTFSDILEEFDFSKYNTAFENQSIRTVIIRNWPNQQFLYTVFLRLNTGSLPLSPQELRQALIPGDFTFFIDEFSSASAAIQKSLGLKKPDYRMRDAEIVVRYYAFKNFIQLYTGKLKEFLDDACRKLNEEWKQSDQNIKEQAVELELAIEATFIIFKENAFSKYASGKYTKIFNRPVFDLMTYYFSQKLIREAAVNNQKLVTDAFENLCTADGSFLRSLETSTKDIEPLTKRFSTWGNTLKNILNINFGVPERTPNGINVI
jgi:hypothetical protein